MTIYTTLQTFPANLREQVILIGNFDGLHKGHQTLITRGRDIAAKRGKELIVLTFEPHPRKFFGKENEPFRLTPFRIKVRELQALGADLLFVLRFNDSISTRPADSFVTDILHNGIGASHVVVGYDFAFGAAPGEHRVRAIVAHEAMARHVASSATAASGSGAPFSSATNNWPV